MNLKKLQEELKTQVSEEYTRGFNHIKQERDRKRGILAKVLNTNIPQGQVRVNLLWKNMQLEKALFLTDEINVKFLSEKGILGEEIMENAMLMAKYDDVDMDLLEQRETIIDHNSLYGLSATVIDSWDDEEKQPIGDTINPLSLIIDPQNYSGSKMRFIGIERRVSKNYLETTDGFEVKDVTFNESTETTQTKRDEAESNNLRYIPLDDGMVDIYDHFCIYDGYKRLTTWDISINTLIRAIQIEPLTKAEKLKPSKCKFPIQLHRRKPKFGSVFGVSIADEILSYQDSITLLTNLQLIQANQLAMGPDILVDDRLGITTSILSQTNPGGRYIPIDNKGGINTRDGIFVNQMPNPSNFIEQMIQSLEGRGEDTTNVNQQAFGTSQTGTQTKAEIQTLQQNINQILMWIGNNYLKGQKEYWAEHYKTYCKNFNKGKKVISLYQKGNAISKTLSKSDFISDGKVNVYIASKSQDSIENDKEFNKLILLSDLYLKNMKPGYSMNNFLRELGRKSNIRDFDEYIFISESVDEMTARKNLSLMNKNIEVPGPQAGEDFMTYILIYRQALDTEVKTKVLAQYERAYTEIQQPNELQQLQGEGSNTMVGMAMNNINQTANKNPGTSLVANQM